MKLLYRILFFLLAIFSTNFSEAKVFDIVVSETNIIVNNTENKNELNVISGNAFGISCKSESKLIAYRSLVKGFKANAAKTGVNVVEQAAARTNRICLHFDSADPNESDMFAFR
jgi:hypothetical protein